MYVLLATGFLGSTTGSEAVLRDLARQLTLRGHRVAAFAPRTGGLRALDGTDVPVVDDLARLDGVPDIIHAQHATSLLPAWRRFPRVPIVQSIQDVSHPLDEPILLPSVRGYVAVDRLRAQRALDVGVPEDRIVIVPNTVDLERFRPKPSHDRIARAIVVAKYHSFLGEIVRRALRRIEVDVLPPKGIVPDFPERLRDYDLLVGSGRCALEAAAVGLSVIVCDERGFAGPLDGESWPAFRDGNFGAALFQGPVTTRRVADAFARLDPSAAASLRDVVRAEASVDDAGRALEAFYGRILAGEPVAEPSDPIDALVAYALQVQVHGMGKTVPWDVAQARQAMAAQEAARDARAAAAPALAVVVMSVGAPPMLADAVRSLLVQSVRPEIVVVNSGGGDAAARLRDAGLEATVVECGDLLTPGGTRNRGIVATRAPFVAFLAMDCLAGPGWVERRLAAHGAGARIVASSVVTDRPRHTVALASHLALFGLRLPSVPAAKASLYGASYDRELFGKCGYFDDTLRVGEDTEFHARVAPFARPSWVPEVRTVHRTSTGVVRLARDQWVRGHRAGRFLRDSQGPLAPGAWRKILARRYSDTSAAFDRHRADGRPVAAWLVRPLIAMAQLSYMLGVRAGNRPERAEPRPPVPADAPSDGRH